LDTPDSSSRRELLKRIALAASAVTVVSTSLRAADQPLISVDAPEAKAVKYVEDCTRVTEAMGNRCDTCSLYQGADGSKQGGCQLFKGKSVTAAGWCTAWAPQM
jgi:high potential iron-sulfur protein